MNLKKIGKLFTSKFVGTGPSSYEKRIYRAAVSRRLRNTGLDDPGSECRWGKETLFFQFSQSCRASWYYQVFYYPTKCTTRLF